MTRAVYLIGEPGVGKTTLMEALSDGYTIEAADRLEGQLWGEKLWAGDRYAGIRLGRSRETFSGTDALGMAVNPDAIRWLETGDLPPLILGEGARLGNLRFQIALHNKTSALTILLRAADAAERREKRGSQQDPNWIKGRATASLKLFHTIVELGLPALSLDTTSMTPEEAGNIVKMEMGWI